MYGKSLPRQLALFSAELLIWESLPQERQQALQEILSLLLEQALSQQTCPTVHNPPEHAPDKNHV